MRWFFRRLDHLRPKSIVSTRIWHFFVAVLAFGISLAVTWVIALTEHDYSIAIATKETFSSTAWWCTPVICGLSAYIAVLEFHYAGLLDFVKTHIGSLRSKKIRRAGMELTRLYVHKVADSLNRALGAQPQDLFWEIQEWFGTSDLTGNAYVPEERRRRTLCVCNSLIGFTCFTFSATETKRPSQLGEEDARFREQHLARLKSWTEARRLLILPYSDLEAELAYSRSPKTNAETDRLEDFVDWHTRSGRYAKFSRLSRKTALRVFALAPNITTDQLRLLSAELRLEYLDFAIYTSYGSKTVFAQALDGSRVKLFDNDTEAVEHYSKFYDEVWSHGDNYETSAELVSYPPIGGRPVGYVSGSVPDGGYLRSFLETVQSRVTTGKVGALK
jgi:hypothetical protein